MTLKPRRATYREQYSSSLSKLQCPKTQQASLSSLRSMIPEIQEVIEGKRKGVILCGDCLEVMREIPDNSVDLVVTDPPYGFGRFETDDSNFLGIIKNSFSEVTRAMKEGGFCFVFSGTGQVINVANLIPLDFKRMLWMYKPNDITFPWRGWLLKSEAILCFSKGNPNSLFERKPYKHDCYIHTKVGQEGVNGHPTVKPLKIVMDLVSRCPKEGIVLDPFLGSGTTAVACK